MNQVMAELLLSAAQSLNAQIVLRLPPWLRVAMAGLLTAGTLYGHHLGCYGDMTCGVLIGIVGGAFGIRIDKLLPGTKISLSLQQAPMSSKPEKGETSPLTPIVATPAKVEAPVAVVADEDGKPTVVPLGPEFTP